MRLILLSILLFAARPLFAQSATDAVDDARKKATELRKAAAADPIVRDVTSPPVQAYLAEQKLRRLNSLARLRQRIAQVSADSTMSDLLPVLKTQLAELESKPLDQVSFDSAYGYSPTTGLLGYAKRVRLIENLADDQSVILVDNVALVMSGLGTSKYASGKFFGLDQAILIGTQGEDYTFQGTARKRFAAKLIDLEALVKSVAAVGPRVINLWPGATPDDAGIEGEERFFELIVRGKPHTIAGRSTRWLTNVTRPSLTIYSPAADNNTGAAMIICPGGGYHNLGWDIEGEEIAAWLNSVGITGIILKYRCPRRPGDVKNVPPDGPLKDAQRAVSLVRHHAADWNIDPKKIGMVGFSAGGHLVGATSTRFEQRTYATVDEIDKVSCRPDFGVMVYSGYFKFNDQGDLSPTVRTPAEAPPLMFVHAADDPISNAEHSITFYLALKRAGARAEMHLYSTGGHGFGVRDVGQPCTTWTDRCLDWLRHEGVLAKPTKS